MWCTCYIKAISVYSLQLYKRHIGIPGFYIQHAFFLRGFKAAVIRFLLFWVWLIPTSLLVGLCGTWAGGRRPDCDRSARWRWWWAAQALKPYVWLQCILLSDWLWCWQEREQCSEGPRLKWRSLCESILLVSATYTLKPFNSICMSVLTFFLCPLLLLPVVLLLSLWHQGSRGQYHMGVGIPQSLTAKWGGVVTWETTPYMGLVLHTV